MAELGIKEIKVDVKGKSLGRAASEVAIILRGKNKASFEPNIRPKIKVVIVNVGELKIFQLKLKSKVYTRYSGFPSGLRYKTLGEMLKKDPKEAFRLAVWGMLPKNRSRSYFIKNLSFE